MKDEIKRLAAGGAGEIACEYTELEWAVWNMVADAKETLNSLNSKAAKNRRQGYAKMSLVQKPQRDKYRFLISRLENLIQYIPSINKAEGKPNE